MTNGYQKVAEGAYCEVWLHKDVAKGIKSAPANDRARAGEILEHLSEYGPEDLHEKKFKFEARYTVGHGQIGVYAVKSYQTRILGGWCEGKPRKFVCPEATIKKKDGADKEQLKRVARKVGECCDG